MDNILKALYYTLYSPTPHPEEEREINAAYQELLHRLKKPERKLVLQIIDAKDAIIDARSLDSFICGFRLAWKLFTELDHYENERPISSCVEDDMGARNICRDDIQK